MFSAKHINLKLGQAGERIARKYLQNKSFSFVGRNYSKKFGEIDLIMKDKLGVLVFIEVKSMTFKTERDLSSLYLLKPEDNLSSGKMKKLCRVCQLFANSNPGLIDEELGWRIDLLAVVFIKECITTHKSIYVKHYENITAYFNL